MDTPNVVLITLDTTRQDRLSCYGYERPTSPNIDAFAEEATVYEDAIAPSIWSLPSHASLFTGEYPHEHGATYPSPFLEDSQTLAGRLREEGYWTTGIAPSFVVRPSAGLDQGFDTFETPHITQLPEPLIDIYQQYSELTSASPTLRKASESIWRLYREIVDPREQPESEWGRSIAAVERAEDEIRRGREPFFLFLNLLDPHLPHHPEQRFRDGLVDRDLEERTEAPTHPRPYNIGDQDLTEDQTELLSQLYDADIRALDHRVGRILDALRAQDLYDETMIVLVGDHGEHLGEDGLIGHEFSVRDEVISVPLIIKFPGQDSPRRVSEPVETRKVYHTILETVSEARGASLLEPDTTPVLGEYFAPMVDVEAARDRGQLEYVDDAIENPVQFIRDRDHKVVSYRGETTVHRLEDDATLTDTEKDEIHHQLIEEIDPDTRAVFEPGDDLPV